MAPARRVAEPQLRGLEFSEPLSWKPSKPITAKVLIERLDTLSKELKTLDQDETDTDSLLKVSKELAGHNLLGHKDRGVRAYTACCLVDILRICAPVAPLAPAQLKDVFTCFITSILPPLADPSNAYNVQHMYVLNSLSEVKSILLVTELSQPESLVLQLFRNSFDILYKAAKSSSGEQIGQKVLNDLTNLLVCLVDEMQSLPADAVDVIVAPFLIPKALSQKKDDTPEDSRQSTLVVKELPPAYNTAKTICEYVPAKMARYISQYFNECMIDVSETTGAKKSNNRKSAKYEESDDDETPSGPSAMELDNLDKAHQLLREVWRACPDVLSNVIPQLEAELSVEDVQLRLLATKTLGDIVSGIGSAGPPPPPTMDPAAYPPVMLADALDSQVRVNPLTMPLSPQSFAQTHAPTYHSFLARRKDKSAVIRAAWTTAIGRIILTSAGGIGLGREDEAQLLQGLAEKLGDGDERVRLAAVKAVAGFGFRDIMVKLAPNGAVTTPGSVLGTLADRVKDLKHPIRIEAMTTLAKIWGVAAAEIAAGNDLVTTALGDIPSKIFDSFYANQVDLRVLLDKVLFEQLVPLNFPPSKIRSAKLNDGHSQGHSQGENPSSSEAPIDPDKIRTERFLLMVRSLQVKAKKAFFSVLSAQPMMANVMEMFLKRCELYNGGVGYEQNVDRQLGATIDYLCKVLPDPPRVNADLWKFAKMHDRRTYALLRFMKNPESDYHTVYKSIKEFRKRIEGEKNAPAGLLEIMDPLIYRGSMLLYNRSHLPAIVQFSKTDEKGLGDTAHEVLADMSARTPDIFKIQVKELCKLLEEQAPTQSKKNDLDSVKTLKALTGFARKYPKEMPNDRKFLQTLLAFAQYGSPPQAAKYAVNILMQATDRKEMHARDLFLKVTTDWTYGSDHFLTKMATISQLALLAPDEAREMADEILDITTQKVLPNVRTKNTDVSEEWQEDSELDEECQAKCWALKILVNNLRGTEDDEQVKELFAPVLATLNRIISKEGEISKTEDTPKPHKARLRLVAAQQLLKLCTIKRYNDLLPAPDFVKLSCVAQDSLFHVRSGFVNKLLKYLGRGAVSSSFYPIVFLLAFEPEKSLREMVATWIRSRVKMFHDTGGTSMTTMENSFPRVLSLLAHHPDYSPKPEDLEDHARYILFYITTVVSKDNLGLVYRYAERLKQTRDGIDASQSDNLYVLSELAQSLLRKYAEKKGWSIQAYSGKLRLPAKIFHALPDHATAQAIVDKQYLPDSVEDLLDRLIRDLDRKKKRKSTDDDGNHQAKKAKTERTKVHKEPSVRKPKAPAKPKKSRTSKTPTVPDSERRRSGRGAIVKEGVSYADRDSSEDDEEMWDGVAEWEYMSGAEPEEKGASDSEREAPGLVKDRNGDASDVEMQDADDQEADPTSEIEPEPENASTPAVKKVNGKVNGKASVKNTPASRSKPKSRGKKASPTPEPEANDDADTEEEEENSPEPEPPAKTKASARNTPASKTKPKSRGRKASPTPEPELETNGDADAEEEEERSPEPTAKTKATARNAPASKAKPKSRAKKSSPTPEPEPETNDEADVDVEEEKSPGPPAKTKALTKNAPVSRTKPKSRAKKASPTPDPETNDEADELVEKEKSPSPEPEVPAKTNGKRKPSKKSIEKTPLPTRSSRRVAAVATPEVEAELEEAADSPLSEMEVEKEDAVPPPKTNGRAGAAKKGAVGKSKPAPKEKVAESRSRAKTRGNGESEPKVKGRVASRGKGKAVEKPEKDIFDMDSD